MAENNIGFFYQKEYFRGLIFDRAGNYKTDPGTVELIGARNLALLDTHALQNSWFVDQPETNSFTLSSLYPGIVPGIGMNHETGIKGELKLGLYFDYTSGMPCIPASSVKGALRSAFPQWKKHNNTPEEIKKTKTCFVKSIIDNIKFEDVTFSTAIKNQIAAIEDEIFEGKRAANTFLSVYEKDIFHDAFILAADSESRILASDAITHHPSPLKNPNPVLFLKIASGVTIKFNFDLKPGALLVEQKIDLFKKIFLTNGIGAKTNVGYGQFE